MKTPNIRPFGEHALLLSWEPIIAQGIHDAVMGWMSQIEKEFSNHITELVPAYASLAVYLKPDTNLPNLMKQFEAMQIEETGFDSEEKYKITVPVCYAEEFAPDMKLIMQNTGFTKKKIISLHTQPLYKTYFLGFLPGFPYLGGLSEELYSPRKETPRTYIPQGSVGIGGSQTGIYTIDSPGGWNIIGKSPIPFFTVENNPPVHIEAGDYVKFEAISRKTFERIEQRAASGAWQIRKEVMHD